MDCALRGLSALFTRNLSAAFATAKENHYQTLSFTRNVKGTTKQW
jgi:hypothetical protein